MYSIIYATCFLSTFKKQNDNDKTIFGHYRVVAMVESSMISLNVSIHWKVVMLDTKKLWQKYVLCVFVWGVMCCNQAVSHSHTALCI